MDEIAAGPAPFSERIDDLFVQLLLSDAVVDKTTAYERQRFEAAARSVRDMLSRRWIDTQRFYDRENPKRVYYLSMEFLIGRSFANYMHLADLTAYLEADRALTELYADGDAWARKAILNVAGSGKFSSDRTIVQYATEIWGVTPCPVP